MEIFKGLSLLLITLGLFSLFSLKAPKGNLAMSGLANAAIATFLVEAIHKYIAGDFFNNTFLNQVGSVSGTMGGVAATAMTMLQMGISPVFSITAAVSVSGYGILPGFIAGYIIAFIAPKLEKKLPDGVNIIVIALILAPLSRGIAAISTPLISNTLDNIGLMINIAANQSPYLMGILLGGIMKVTCTSPLSSMALTAMLGLTGLPMGIAAIATFGGSFTNGIIFHKLNLGNKGNVVSVMLEPLTQADIITKHAVPIYFSNFIGGALAGLSAAYFGIINNAPGTASPIPGFFAPFAFNPTFKVILALFFAAIGGILAGYLGGFIFRDKDCRKCMPFPTKA